MTAAIADRAPSNCEGLAAEPAPGLPPRLAAIRAAAIPAWRRMLHHLRGGDLA